MLFLFFILYFSSSSLVFQQIFNKTYVPPPRPHFTSSSFSSPHNLDDENTQSATKHKNSNNNNNNNNKERWRKRFGFRNWIYRHTPTFSSLSSKSPTSTTPIPIPILTSIPTTSTSDVTRDADAYGNNGAFSADILPSSFLSTSTTPVGSAFPVESSPKYPIADVIEKDGDGNDDNGQESGDIMDEMPSFQASAASSCVVC